MTQTKATLDYASPPPRRSHRRTIFWITALAVTVVSLAFSLHYPTTGMATESRNRSKCISNLKRVHQAILQYSTNHGSYPASLGDLVLNNLDPEAMICPSSNDLNAAGTPQQQAAAVSSPGPNCSYIYSGAQLNQASPKNSILVYEKKSNHANEGMHILQNDGQVRWLPQKAAEHVIAKIQAGHNPPLTH
jgi:type II secretory pathway pseudopilin PulG